MIRSILSPDCTILRYGHVYRLGLDRQACRTVSVSLRGGEESVMTTVFEIASQFLKMDKRQSIESLKLQKLCFYAFGWYAHLTARSLFSEAFYAMPYGPVVGELLSAHAGELRVSVPMIDRQISERQDGSEVELSPYVQSVLSGVWSHFRNKSAWDMVEETHRETVWEDAWEARPEGSKRGTMGHPEIVEYFLNRSLSPSEAAALPDPLITIVDSSELGDRKELRGEYLDYFSEIAASE